MNSDPLAHPAGTPPEVSAACGDILTCLQANPGHWLGTEHLISELEDLGCSNAAHLIREHFRQLTPADLGGQIEFLDQPGGRFRLRFVRAERAE